MYYIPELKNNLLNMGQLQEKGIAILIKNNMCKLFHDSRGLIMKSEMSANRMFVVLASTNSRNNEQSACFKAESENVMKLWHCRMGHLSYKGLRTMYYKNMVKGLPLLKAP